MTKPTPINAYIYYKLSVADTVFRISTTVIFNTLKTFFFHTAVALYA